MAFEVFDQPRGRAAKGATVTINSRGDFSLSAAAYHLLGGPSHVEMLFDSNRQLVAFRPAAESAPNAYLVRGSTGTRMVSGAAFVRFHSIDHSTGRRWQASLVDGLLQFDLASEYTPVTSNRKKSR